MQSRREKLNNNIQIKYYKENIVGCGDVYTQELSHATA